jgi:hypothetical protein
LDEAVVVVAFVVVVVHLIRVGAVVLTVPAVVVVVVVVVVVLPVVVDCFPLYSRWTLLPVCLVQVSPLFLGLSRLLLIVSVSVSV